MTDEKARIIARIEKLMAIANDKSDAEADAALLLAQRLMAEYHLSEVEINANDKEEVITTKTDIGYKDNGWKRYLAGVIARNFRCATYYNTATRGLHGQIIIFLGEESDARLAQQTYHFAIENGEYRYNDFRKNFFTCHDAKITFLTSYARGINSKFEEQKAANQQWGLVLVQPASVKEAYSKITLRSVRNTNAYVRDAYSDAKNEGYRAGRQFNAAKGVLA